MLEEYFKEVGLTYIELPIELVDGRPVYQGYLKELPALNELVSREKVMQQKLAKSYQAYRERLLAEVEERRKEKR